MSVISTIKFVTTHPLTRHHKLDAVLRLIKWQINTRLNPYPVIYPYTEKAKLVIHKGMTGATGNVYCGLHEYNDMAFLMHLLRKEDCFVDVGANIGSYTILASAHVGAKTVCIEPVPSTFSNLTQNIYINGIQEKVTAHNIAMGSAKGNIHFNSSCVLDTMNHVAVKEEKNTISVPVEILDDILHHGETPLLLKIDVEGFETEVIKGAMKTLGQQGLKAIIIELNGSGSRYGYDEREIHNTLIGLNFQPFQYDPKERALTFADYPALHNIIYVRDLAFVQQRVKTAHKIKILHDEI